MKDHYLAPLHLVQAGGDDQIRFFSPKVTEPLPGALLWDPALGGTLSRKQPFFSLLPSPINTATGEAVGEAIPVRALLPR